MLTVASDVTRFAPGPQYWLVVRLVSDRGIFEGEAPILAECWNTTSFVIDGFEGASCVRSVEIGVKNEGEEPWAGLFQIGSVSVGEICDFAFEVPGAWKSFSATGGSVSFDKGLKFTFDTAAASFCAVTSPYFPDAHNTKYNAPLELRNTLFFVLDNNSTADRVRLWFLTSGDPDYRAEKSKEFDIVPLSGPKAYFFNLSDVPEAKGRLAGFRLQFLNGAGDATVLRVTPEEEAPIRDFCGRIISCRADSETVRVRLSTDIPGTVRVYETFMFVVEDVTKGRALLCERYSPGERPYLNFL